MTRTLPRLRAFAGALVAAGILGSAKQAHAQPSDGLPGAIARNWTTDRLTRAEPPYIDGAIAQIRGNGEGRFAIICRRGERKAMMAYLPPAKERQRLLDDGGEMPVTFTFDGDDAVRRTLKPTDPPFWTAEFGPESRLAKLMKRAFKVNLNLRDDPDLDSDFTLDRSWASIEEMFATCRR